MGVLVLPLLITFCSTHQSPSTVKRNARVLTIGTVKLNSALYVNTLCLEQPAHTGRVERTSLSDQQEEPDTASQID